MARQYGTKVWLKWAAGNLDFALGLLKDPAKQWDTDNTHLEAAIRSLNVLKSELQVDGKK